MPSFGILVNNLSLQHLWDRRLSRTQDYLCTFKLSQDNLELLFNKIRKSGKLAFDHEKTIMALEFCIMKFYQSGQSYDAIYGVNPATR